MKKRILALLLALCLVASVVPAQVVLAEGTEAQAVTTNLDVQGMEGTFTVTQNGTVVCDGQEAWQSPDVIEGTTLESLGYSVTDPVYWDPTRAFEGWLPQLYVPDVGGTPIEGATVLTTAQMLAYPARGDYQVSFIAQWAGERDDYYTVVEFDGYGGTFVMDFAYSGDGYENWSGLLRESGKTVKEEAGIVSFADPTHPDGYTFGGWLAFSYAGNGDWILADETVYTTAQLLATTVPEEDVTYYAYWNELGMDHYRYMNSGILGGDSTVANVTVNGHNREMEASLTVTKNGQAYGGSGTGLFVPAGSNLKDAGYAISDVAFWDSSRQLEGWKVYQVEPYYEDGQYLWDEWVQVPGTDILTMDQMLAYPVALEESLRFEAQWSGEEDDYYSGVAFDGFNGTYTVYFGGNEWGTISWENWSSREGAVIGPECGRYFDGDLDIQNPTREGNDFLGWIEYSNVEGNWQMVSEQPVATADLLTKTVTENDMLFVAYWNNVPWDEYANYSQGGGEGGWGDGFQIPEGVTPTVLQLDVKAPLPGDWTGNYYSFTAPEDGYYNLCYDSTDSRADIWDNNDSYFWISPMTGKCAISLQAGQEYLFQVSTSRDCQIWIEEAVAITSIQILDKDTTKSFQKTNGIDTYQLLDGLTIKATFSDGSTQTVTLPENYSYSIGGFDPVVSFEFETATGNTAPVSVQYCDAVATYTAKLDSAMVTKVEVVSDKTPIEVIENTMGSMDSNYSGEYYWYSVSQILYSKASFRFTWSDGTTETLKLEPEEAYHGISLNYQETYNQGDEHWTTGNTYNFNLYYGQLAVPVSIKIVESPISSITILSEPTNILGHPYFAPTGDGTWRMQSFDPSGLSFRLNVKDGTTETYAFEDLQVQDYNYYAGTHLVEFNTVDGRMPVISGPDEIPIYIIVDGAKQTFHLNVVEKIIENNQTTVAPSVIEDALANKEQTGDKIVVDASSGSADITDGSRDVNSVNLPVDSMNDVAEAEADLHIKLDNAEVTFDQSAVDAIASQAGQTEEANITLTVKEVPVTSLTDKQIHKIQSVLKNQDQDPLVLDITLKVGDETISSFQGGKVTIRVPFTPPAGTKGEDYTVFYVPDNANAQVQRMETTYEDGCLVFTTSHFSDYVALSNTPDNTIDDPGMGSNGGTVDGGGSKVPAPDTGDNANIFGISMLMLMSGMLAVCLLVFKKKARA